MTITVPGRRVLPAAFFLAAIGASILGLGLFGAAPALAQRGPGGPGGAGGPVVAVDAVKQEPFRQTMPVLGRLVALRAGNVAARVAGAVAEFKVEVGDRVAQGDVLAVLVNDRLKADRNNAEALLEQRKAQLGTAVATSAKIKSELSRMEALRQSTAFNKSKFDDMAADGAIAESRVAESRAQMRQAEVQLAQAELDLGNAVVRAPYPGVVTSRNTEVGAYVGLGVAVAALLNDADVEIEAEIPTDRLGGLTAGSKLEIQLDDGTAHTALVRAIVPQENPTTRTRTVRFTPSFGQTSKAFATNQSVRVLIPSGAAEIVLTIHKDAVLVRNGGSVVYVLKDGKVEERGVVLGNAVRDRLVVKTGVQENDAVVVRGNEQLRPGQTVRVGAQG